MQYNTIQCNAAAKFVKIACVSSESVLVMVGISSTLEGCLLLTERLFSRRHHDRMATSGNDNNSVGQRSTAVTLITFTFFVLCGTRLPRMFLVARPKPFHSRFDFVDSRIDSPASSSNTSSKRGWLLNAILLFTLLCSLRKSRRKAVIPRQAKRRSWEGKTQFHTIQAAQRKI